MTASALLEVKNLSAGYGSFQALFNISLAVNAGEAVGCVVWISAATSSAMRSAISSSG